MKPSRVFLTVTTLAVALLFTVAVLTVHAGGKAPPAPPVDPRKLITAVDAAAGAIVIEYMRDKTNHSYVLDGLTAIKVNNSTGTIAQIKVGMQVRDFVERDAHTLDSITVSNADPAPVAPKKKK
jgi:hypothetical protein